MTRLARTGAVEIERGVAVETFRNTPVGIEQSWRFDRRPSGKSDLAVRVRLSAPVHYGAATWVDASGRRTPVGQTKRGNEIVLTVPRAVLEASTFPATLDPLISAEIATDDPVLAAASGSQWNPVAAFDGTNFLVVWGDGRSETPGVIYGTRVTAAGVLLDPLGIAICNTADVLGAPAVAFDGVNFLVAWSTTGGRGVRATRVSPLGVVLDVPALVISAFGSSPGVAYGAGQHLVVWNEQRDGGFRDGTICGARVTQAGGLVDPDCVPISTAPGAKRQPSVAYGNGRFLVAWLDARDAGPGFYWDAFAARVDLDGGVLDPDGISLKAVTGPESTVAVASDGTGYAVVWRDYRQGASSTFVARVDVDGAVLSSAPIVDGGLFAFQADPSILFDGANYFVTWRDRLFGPSNIRGAHLSPSGVALDPGGLPLLVSPEDQYAPSAGSDGTGYLVLAHEYGVPSTQVIGQLFTPAGLPVNDGGAFRLARSANTQSQPSLAASASSYLLTWSDNRQSPGSGSSIFAIRLSADGGVKDSPAREIWLDGGTASAAASNGDEYLVAWVSGTKIVGARISQSGALLDPGGIELAAAGLGPVAVGSDQQDFLVAWSRDDGDGGLSDKNVVARRVSASGVVLDSAPIAVSTAAGQQVAPEVAFDGTNYWVLWEDGRSAAASGVDIYGARVARTGAVLDPAGVAISSASANQTAVSASFDGARLLVVWQDGRDAGTGLDIRGTFISGVPTVPPPELSISSAAGEQGRPSTAFDGLNHVVVWRDLRSGSWFELYASRVTPPGMVLDPTGFLISAEPAHLSAPKISSVSLGRSLVAYSYLDGRAGLHSQRVHARTVLELAEGSPCGSGAECASGSCVDQSCCESGCSVNPPLGPRWLQVGCGCGAFEGLGSLFWLLPLGWRLGRARTRTP